MRPAIYKKNRINLAMVTVFLAVLFLCFSSYAQALMIQFDNLSGVGVDLTGVQLGFDTGSIDPIMVNYDHVEEIFFALSAGGTFVSNDIPEITPLPSSPQITLDIVNILPFNTTFSYPTGLQVLPDLSCTLNAASWGSLKLTFTNNIGGETIPEPASLILLGSGLLGLIVLRKKKK